MPLRKIFITLSLFSSSLMAGESMLSTTYQPLDGLGSGLIKIAPVACHDWYSHGGGVRGVGLISAKNVPPTNNPTQAKEDLNLASICGVHFSSADSGNGETLFEVTIDLREFSVPKNIGFSKEEVVRASLECLRLCIPNKSKKTPLSLLCKDADKIWLTEIITEFNGHDHTKVFFVPKS